VKRALISDIHANYEALEAVLAHIRSQGAEEIICLGDIIGYGPDPLLCLDRVMAECQRTILGNHDQAALFDPEGFNPVARRAIYWTRDQMERDKNLEQADLRWDFLGSLPRRHDEGKYLFVHGSPRDPTNEYVFPEHVYEPVRMNALMSRFEQYCFQGHTHIPGVFTDDLNFRSPEEINFEHTLDEHKTLINVGSVGQPRNGDARSSYVILDGHKVNFRRVEYDFNETAQKIYNEPDLDDYLGDRLRSGK